MNHLIKEVRCADTIKYLFNRHDYAVFFTLTTPDKVDYVEIRQRWRAFRHYLTERLYPLKYVMNYELHPFGHGWHIHAVMDRFIPLVAIREKLNDFGFGRVDVRKVDNLFVSQYLTKHCLKAYRGALRKERLAERLRLVNSSRGLPKLSDYHVVGDYIDFVRQRVNDWDFFRKENATLRLLSFPNWWRLCEMSVLLETTPDRLFPLVSRGHSFL